ncbi:MAG: putative membrane protein [Candidatus Peregrinibacteria bacterium Greene0416_19]|nr:MAG: putative membrane protein [Candidatus Peregrinibacteria bacterium Greene0416_19]
MSIKSDARHDTNGEVSFKRMSAPARIFLKFLGNTILIWMLARFLPQYVTVGGGLAGAVVIGALLTLLNLFLRPLLGILFLPLRLLAHILAIILLNAVFLWVIVKFVGLMDSSVVTLAIKGGWGGWIVVSLAIGLANWVMKEVIKPPAHNPKAS